MATFKAAVQRFKINDCKQFGLSSQDTVNEALQAIHAFSTLLSMGFRSDDDSEAPLHNVNPALIGSAFDGIAMLAAAAQLHIDNDE